MSLDFLKFFDGTDAVPRDVQRQGLEWIADKLGSTEVLVIRGPVGCGKSKMAVAIQQVTKAPIITPSNLLIDQYTGDYPATNSLKGKAHYHCDDGLSCEDVKEVLQAPPCEGCPYQTCRSRALAGHATFYNPMSYFYLTKAEEWVPPRFLVVDEAHQLASMILMMAGKRFDSERFDFDDRVRNMEHLKLWLRTQRGQLYRLAEAYKKQGDKKKAVEIERESANMYFTLQGLEEDPDNYAVWIEQGTKRGRRVRYLNVKPVTPPKFITARLLNAERIILLSGTMFDHDIKELLPGREYGVLDLPSPIPPERRPVIWRPTPFKMNWKTPPGKVADAVKGIIEDEGSPNTIIHVAYSMSQNLAPHMGNVLTNTSDDKIEKLETFKKEGGTFLAAGCAEGIDLKGDLCRLNIIPKLLYPNLNDPVVKKRMELPDGDEWYNLETLKTLIQQTGRSTRSEEDHSKCFVLDPGFGWRVKKYHKQLPKSFLEAIVREKKK